MCRRPWETPRTPPHLADQALCAAEEADTARRDRIYVAHLNYSECKTGPIYRAETLQVEHGVGRQSEHQSPGQRMLCLPPSHLSQRHLWPRLGPQGGGGNGARSHDARWGEDGAHTQGVCDLPATGQRLAHTLSVFILFWRQQLLLQCFPVGKREAAIMDPAGWGLLMTLYQETWPHWVYGSHLNPRAQPRAGAREGLLTPLSPLS